MTYYYKIIYYTLLYYLYKYKHVLHNMQTGITAFLHLHIYSNKSYYKETCDHYIT